MTRSHDLTTAGRVIDLAMPSGVSKAVDGAVLAAERAARSAGVRVSEIHRLDDLDAVNRLYEAIWGREENPPLTRELLRAFAKSGNYVVGAFDGSQLVGACVGFFAAPADGSLHSHIAGVSAAVRGRRVGFALKLHQRAWAMARGVSLIAWTFDPLVSRNAYFNLGKLAASPVEYLPNFYGGIRDGINGEDDSDRLLIHWTLSSPEVVAACAGRGRVAADAAVAQANGAVVALGHSELGGPVPGRLDGLTSLIAVPGDVEALRRLDPGLGKEWRVAVREALVTLMGDGANIIGFDRTGWFIVERPGARPRPGEEPR